MIEKYHFTFYFDEELDHRKISLYLVGPLMMNLRFIHSILSVNAWERLLRVDVQKVVSFKEEKHE